MKTLFLILAFALSPGFSAGPAEEAAWEEAPPMPTDWAHQLGIDERSLADGPTFRDAVESLLK